MGVCTCLRACVRAFDFCFGLLGVRGWECVFFSCFFVVVVVLLL